jgi:hypothetical protein
VRSQSTAYHQVIITAIQETIQLYLIGKSSQLIELIEQTEPQPSKFTSLESENNRMTKHWILKSENNENIKFYDIKTLKTIRPITFQCFRDVFQCFLEIFECSDWFIIFGFLC